MIYKTKHALKSDIKYMLQDLGQDEQNHLVVVIEGYYFRICKRTNRLQFKSYGEGNFRLIITQDFDTVKLLHGYVLERWNNTLGIKHDGHFANKFYEETVLTL